MIRSSPTETATWDRPPVFDVDKSAASTIDSQSKATLPTVHKIAGGETEEEQQPMLSTETIVGILLLLNILFATYYIVRLRLRGTPLNALAGAIFGVFDVRALFSKTGMSMKVASDEHLDFLDDASFVGQAETERPRRSPVRIVNGRIDLSSVATQAVNDALTSTTTFESPPSVQDRITASMQQAYHSGKKKAQMDLIDLGI